MATVYGKRIRIPLLKELVDRLLKSGALADPESIVVVLCHHYLSTLVDLVLAIIYLGVPENQIYCCCKNYSYNEKTHRRLLALGVHSFGGNRVTIPGTFGVGMVELAHEVLGQANLQCRARHCKKAVIVNDGFCMIEEAVKLDWGEADLTGVLQTGSASYLVNRIKAHPIPLVDIAYSATKSILESYFIVARSLDDVRRSINNNDQVKTLGVVGVGNIGQNTLSRVREFYPQMQIVCYDECENVNAMVGGISLEQLLQDSDLVIGCCGRDMFAKLPNVAKDILQGKFGNKVFASFSSGDYEFLTVLRLGAEAEIWQKMGNDCHGDLVCTTMDGRSQIRVLNGGYPINFDGSDTSVRSEIIQLTRALLLAAFVEAANRSELEVRGVSCPEEMIRELNAKLQQEIATSFLQMVDRDCHFFSKETHNNFLNIDWIAQHSKYNFENKRD